ncbi:MAG: RIP metalloprotease RseP [Bacteroidetes Order II. Incertae sedis bacterium]|nr:RIP metalloprotease RseP [Bacteroidetes Order II. bacterium]
MQDILSSLGSVGNVLTYVFWVILALFILVLVHEMGHFLSAKAFGMRVERFSIGFPPKILGKQIGETEYVIGATPLGGYVKISGMIDESMDTGFVEGVPEPWEFRAKPVWQKMVVITAGVIFNMILAIIIFSTLKLTYGEPYIPIEQIAQFSVEEGSLAYDMGLRTGDRIVAVNGKQVKRHTDILNIGVLMADNPSITVNRNGNKITLNAPPAMVSKLSKAQGNFGITPYFHSRIGEVVPDMPAEKAGLKANDKIVGINGNPIRFWEEMTDALKNSQGKPLDVKWVRSAKNGVNDTLSATIVPKKEGESYLLGVGRSATAIEYFSLGGAIAAGTRETWTNATGTLLMFKKLIMGQENVRDALGGPVMIARETKRAADQGAYSFWRIVALLSVTLAVVNILPIPALDGGHLVFLIYEAIARKEPSPRFRMIAQQVGMVLLLALMVFLVFNDVLRIL